MPGQESAPRKTLVTRKGARGSNRKRSVLIRFMFTTMITTTMIVTGGMGTFPPNQLTSSAAGLVGENLPAQLIQPVNQVLAQVAAPTLEIVERPRSENPGFAEFMEELIAPLFPTEAVGMTEPTTAAGAIQTEVANAIPTFQAELTQTAEIAVTLTGAASVTETGTTPTQTTLTTIEPSITAQVSLTETPAPSATTIYLPLPTAVPPPTNTREPPPPLPTSPPADTLTPTVTGTPTMTTTVTSPIPAGAYISALNLNGSGSNILNVSGGASVSLDYTYQVWGDSSTCPGCSFQLVWGLDNAWQRCYGWTSPGPGDYPGQTGSALVNGINFTLTAPATPGTYTIYYFAGQYADCTAAIAAYSMASATWLGTITVTPADLILYSYGATLGNLGGRSGADALCASSSDRPVGYTSYRAFISISESDSIALLPTNYGVPTALPFKSSGGVLIANNWADLVDGTISVDLLTAGISPGQFWWSGTESDDGNALPATLSCLNYTSSAGVNSGKIADATLSGAGWLSSNSTACSNSAVLLCLASP